MQRIELLEEVVGKTQVHTETAEQNVTPPEYITDEVEIRNMIRRAVTISWRDSIFSFDELAERLQRNDVILPVPDEERDEYFETTLNSIWHQQKELARAALQPLPTRVRYMVDAVEHHGIVIPGEQSFVSEVMEEPVVAENNVIVLEIAAPNEPKVLESPDVARMIFDELMSSNDTEPRMVVGDFASRLRNEYPDTNGAMLRSVIRQMIDNGYVTSYTTGKKRQQKTWITMSAEARTDLLDEIAQDGFETMLEYVFDDQQLRA